ncbi:efflux RND transporter permease subunit [Candidatus Coxiella mudrowiae]|uniref:efflux RND transporter permease subunit n=1 Tax=Candidatus Coxiella mudrowiae TaxID=2054173 RepID=UPI002467F63A|nr:efflux RND transporter permease subunit [Candidatus Coxiella mudrowiae]
MWFLDYSINLLTLLVMVLVIGLVVDDEIIVVENMFRHVEERKGWIVFPSMQLLNKEPEKLIYLSFL